MRVISGSLRGRRLEAPSGMTTRPTTDKVKESLFSSIQFELPGAYVLDLFAGSGQLGLEAISRGAARCTFVEQDRNAISALSCNIEVCRLTPEQYTVSRGDSYAFLASHKGRQFDVILLDPPYGGSLLRRAIEDIARFDILTDDGIMICEKAPNDVIEPLPQGFRVVKEYKYGQIMLCRIVKEGKE